MEAEIAAIGGAPRVLLLGVTPELATLRWPPGTRLRAIDRSQAMIDAIFPAGLPIDAAAVLGDWLALPCAAASIDLALGDGSSSLLEFPAGYRKLATELRRVLARDGRVVLRLFTAPDQHEPLPAVAAALAAGAIHSLHALKWRIAMAIQPADRNVAVVEILRAFEGMVPDRGALAQRTGWAPETIATIDVYRESNIVYSFPTLTEVRAVFDDFVETACHTPRYELGARCPTLVLRAN